LQVVVVLVEMINNQLALLVDLAVEVRVEIVMLVIHFLMEHRDLQILVAVVAVLVQMMAIQIVPDKVDLE
jgi:hypothetical protein